MLTRTQDRVSGPQLPKSSQVLCPVAFQGSGFCPPSSVCSPGTWRGFCGADLGHHSLTVILWGPASPPVTGVQA